jgi:hypothetical protein
VSLVVYYFPNDNGQHLQTKSSSVHQSQLVEVPGIFHHQCNKKELGSGIQTICQQVNPSIIFNMAKPSSSPSFMKKQRLMHPEEEIVELTPAGRTPFSCLFFCCIPRPHHRIEEITTTRSCSSFDDDYDLSYNNTEVEDVSKSSVLDDINMYLDAREKQEEDHPSASDQLSVRPSRGIKSSFSSAFDEERLGKVMTDLLKALLAVMFLNKFFLQRHQQHAEHNDYDDFSDSLLSGQQQPENVTHKMLSSDDENSGNEMDETEHDENYHLSL